MESRLIDEISQWASTATQVCEQQVREQNAGKAQSSELFENRKNCDEPHRVFRELGVCFHGSVWNSESGELWVSCIRLA